MSPTRRGLLALGAAILAPAARAAPKARLIDPSWARFGTEDGPDPGPWAAWLDRYHAGPGADGIARLRYGAASRPEAWLAQMQAVDPARLTRAAAMAYWINLYNALTVDLVLQAWPVRSIKSVRGGLFGTGPWGARIARVAGAELSLDDIEHGILRPVFGDPRVHYAVNCAALGCPDLAPRPYTAASLEPMLEAGARAYVNHPRGARVAAGALHVSSIYRWFIADFGGTDAGVIAHLRGHADPALAAALAGITAIADDDYDWAINAA